MRNLSLVLAALLIILVSRADAQLDDLFNVGEGTTTGWRIDEDSVLRPKANSGLFSKVEVIEATDGDDSPNVLVVTTDSGAVIIDKKGLKHNLPNSEAGAYITIVCGSNSVAGITIDTAEANDTIIWASDDTSLDAADSIVLRNPQKGNAVKLIGLGSNEWIAITTDYGSGKWADNGTN